MPIFKPQRCPLIPSSDRRWAWTDAVVSSSDRPAIMRGPLIKAAFLIAVASARPSAQDPLKERGSCNHDNLLRLFLDKRYSSSASDFCSSYIAPTVTALVTET